jgi:putative transposase
MSTRDIEAHLRELYGVSVGRDLISRVTDAVMDDVREWQTRTLEDLYPVVFLDCMVLKIRDGGSVQRRACYLALGIGIDGERDVLGMWFQDTEGAKFWMQVLSELRDRGVRDILICCVDGLEGFPEAIEAVFPLTTVQTCIVHYADLPVMPSFAPDPCGGGRIGPIDVGIIRGLRGRRGACRGVGSGRVWRPGVWFGRALSL